MPPARPAELCEALLQALSNSMDEPGKTQHKEYHSGAAHKVVPPILPRVQTLTILLAEDSSVNVTVALRLLERLGPIGS